MKRGDSQIIAKRIFDSKILESPRARNQRGDNLRHVFDFVVIGLDIALTVTSALVYILLSNAPIQHCPSPIVPWLHPIYDRVLGRSLPLIIAGDIPGQEIEHPMAIVILGGLIISALLNLLVVPTLYLHFGKPKEVVTTATTYRDSLPSIYTIKVKYLKLNGTNTTASLMLQRPPLQFMGCMIEERWVWQKKHLLRTRLLR